MKKIFGSLLLMLAFSLNLNAQEAKKVNPNEEAKKDAIEMQTLLKLDATKTADLTRLFEMKYDYLNQNLSDERKVVLKQSIEAKIRASLTDEQMSKLESKSELFKKLIN